MRKGILGKISKFPEDLSPVSSYLFIV